MAVVLLLGAILTGRFLPVDALWFVPLLLVMVRPLSVLMGIAGSHTPRVQRSQTAWFDIRGIGSVYRLTYAVEHGLPADLPQRLTGLALATVTVPILAHGISVRLLIQCYSRATPQG